ncbi:hypothetical protein SAMN04489806_1828 [Paramicrobacterium humi]|jgi:hypothetical protein|uniref:Uncharacterized protein n=1 Tax=Paramicrobacterium humi TaxID=640635 RepID=A0A1H4MCR9_9MICO|nr:hypothetical protein [Microbacterium humi]SEB80809.1 hypothetical protein SAMN04489806_1828 [Microbacterium humi]
MARTPKGSRATRTASIGLVLLVVGVLVAASTTAQFAVDNIGVGLSIVLWLLSLIAIVWGIVLLATSRRLRRDADTSPTGDTDISRLPGAGGTIDRLPLDDIEPPPPGEDPRDPDRPDSGPSS